MDDNSPGVTSTKVCPAAPLVLVALILQTPTASPVKIPTPSICPFSASQDTEPSAPF